MKRIYILFVLLILGLENTFSQVSNQNYICTRIMLNENASKYLETIQYYDGLGRPSLNVQKNITPSGLNLLTLQEYDDLGRESKTWLPYANSLDYLSPEDIKKKISATYDEDSRTFNESVYEASPLNRITEQYGPGDSWNTHPVSTNYLINTTTEILACKLYEIDDSGSLVQNGNYPSGSLYVNKITNEDGNPSYSFVDMLGQTVLTREMNGSWPHDTYYVYDDFGNLRFVLPPAYQEGAQDMEELSLYAYQYKYDERNRCIEKTLPGCQPIYYVYDKADNLALSQDGVQRTKHEWSFVLYDALNRMVATGIAQTQSSRKQLADKYKNDLFRATFVNSCSSDPGKLDNLFGYETSVLSNYTVKVLAVNYYDSYGFLALKPFKPTGIKIDMDYVEDTSFGIKHDNAQGLLTGAYVRQLDALGKGELIAHYYDIRGREIQTRNTLLPIGHHNYTWTQYNFTGQPLRVKYQHISVYALYPYPPGHPMGNNNQSELYEYDYDNAGRLERIYHTHDDGEKILLSESVYDNLGRLKEKRRHNDMDIVQYTYNIRGWISSIKSQGFTQKLHYTTGFSSGCIPRYNGNIAEIEYEQNDNSYNYIFSYDGLNRLSTAYSRDKQGNEIPNHELYEYDKMGNITFLERKFSESKMDVLNIQYTGNHIKKVSTTPQAFTHSFDFESMSYPDLSDATVEYYYDGNGNLIKNLDKGVVATRYNLLNLPDTIQFQNGNQIINSYLADGRKMKTVYKTYKSSLVVPQDSVYHGNLSYNTSIDEWNGHYMYRSFYGQGLKMFMIQTPEGYIGADYSSIDYHRNYAYYYYVHDHLGNVRITRNSQEYNVDQSLEYYPSGVLFDRSTEKSRQPYMFGGKELVNMHGLNEYDFISRWQDPVVSSFTSMDLLCEKYYSVSPYVYCMNNPIKFVDPTGMSIEDGNGIFGRIQSFFKDLFTLKIDTSSEETKNATVERYEQQLTTIGNLNKGVETMNDIVSTVNPIGSATLTLLRASNGQEISTGDVAFSIMEIAPIGIIEKGAKAAKTANSIIKASDLLRIENAATRIGKPINVVGSRASGTAGVLSDWDYVIEGLNSSLWSKIKNSLPGAKSAIDNIPRNIDLIKTPLDKTKPYITVYPRK